MRYNLATAAAELARRLKLTPGRRVEFDASDRAQEDVSRYISPLRVDEIMTAANGGDPARQSQLSSEIAEKDHTISHALGTRRLALLGTALAVEPGDDSAAAAAAAAHLADELAAIPDEYDNLYTLCDGLLGALLPGYAAAEIVWLPGGGIGGFQLIDSRHIAFGPDRKPLLLTCDAPMGMPLPAAKFIVHRMGRAGGDPARGGLIRPLAWLYCFGNIAMKDLLGFTERFGMPFVVARVDRDSFDRELNLLRRLIRSFGPSGGGVFTKGTELDLLQASNNTGEIYFRLLEYLDAAKEKVILGQTATSGGGGGLSHDNAQAAVRQDLLEADGKALAATLTTQLALPWARFNYGDRVAAPVITFDTTPPEDKTQLGDLLTKLTAAGFELDPEEVSRRVGLTLTRKAAADAPAALGDAPLEMSVKERLEAIGIGIRAGVITATPEIEELIRRQLGLPAPSAEVRRAWEATGGIRQPITLKTSESAAIADELNVDNDQAAARPAALEALEAATPAPATAAIEARHLAPLLDKLTAVLTGELDPAVLAELSFADFAGAELDNALANSTITGVAAGMAAEADKLTEKLLNDRR